MGESSMEAFQRDVPPRLSRRTGSADSNGGGQGSEIRGQGSGPTPELAPDPAPPEPPQSGGDLTPGEAIALRPSVDGKFLRVAGKRFWVRAVTYGTFLPNSQGELFPEPAVVGRDMQQMAAAGVNTVRTYMAPPAWFLDLAHQQGLMVIAGLVWDRHR